MALAALDIAKPFTSSGGFVEMHGFTASSRKSLASRMRVSQLDAFLITSSIWFFLTALMVRTSIPRDAASSMEGMKQVSLSSIKPMLDKDELCIFVS